MDFHRRLRIDRLAPGLFAAALLPVLGSVFAASWRGKASAGDPATLLILCAGGASWAIAVSLARRGFGDLRLVAAGAIALRLVAWSGEPGYSDDAYRYLWEGEVVLAGTSPYSVAPDAAAALPGSTAAALRARYPELWVRVNHKEVSAAYPPLAQAVGASAAALCRWVGAAPEKTGVAILRGLFGICDLLVLWPITRLLDRARLPRALAVVWGWCPIPALEFAGSGHLDSLSILLFTGALAAQAEPRQGRSLGLLSAGILTKYLPAVALPWLVHGRRATVRIALVAAACAVAFAPFVLLAHGDVSGLVRGLREYAFRWDAGSLVHRWIEPVFTVAFARDESWTDPRRLSRACEAVAWLALAIAVVRRERDVLRGTGALLGAWLVLSPALQPWYLCWILPALLVRDSAAWLWLVAASPLLYWPLDRWKREGVWTEPGWLWPVLALPFFALLAIEFRSRRASRTTPGQA